MSKTKYILHGGYTKHDIEDNHAYYKEIVSSTPENGTVLVSLFAREDEDIDRRYDAELERFSNQQGGKKLNFVLANKEDFVNQIKQADTIYFDGGDTDKLLAFVKTIPHLKELFKNKVVVGTSAGAYILSKYYHTASHDEIREGLGFVPVRVVCHFESPEFESRSKPIEKMSEFSNDYELVILRDHEWRVFNI